ncbi:MAG: MBL fold metallo-hydrolase, partial [Deltaproteobacteria bacterium]|nr:MBL fold metallo-hydrolase [Deltaproteobacteria bacterium]
YMITLPMPFRLQHVHVFLLLHGDQLVLFDTGLDTPENLLTLETAMQRIGKKVQDIARIYITHSHIDHCGMAGRIKEISGAAIHMSEISRPFTLRSDGEIQLVKDFCLLHGLPHDVTDGILSLFISTRAEIAGPFCVDRSLQHHERQIFGNWEFQAMPTPGHTHDHMSFYFPQQQILLAGDHVLPEITPNLSPDVFAPDFQPLSSFFASLELIQELPVTKVYPAHGRPFANLKERIGELKEHHQVRKELTLKSVKTGPKTAFQVSQDIFGSSLPEFDQFLALNETYVHLIELIGSGNICETKDGGHVLFAPVVQ